MATRLDTRTKVEARSTAMFWKLGEATPQIAWYQTRNPSQAAMATTACAARIRRALTLPNTVFPSLKLSATVGPYNSGHRRVLGPGFEAARENHGTDHMRP